MKKLLLTLAAGIVLCSCGSHDPQIAIVPYPNHLETGRGTYRVTDRPVTCDSRTDERTQRAVVGFAARLATVTGGTNPVTVADEVPASGIRFVTDESLPAEGYELNVDGEGIEVRASQFPGFLYALQSLEQLLPAAVYGTEPAPDAAWEVPCVKIADAPRFAYRGMHLDVARHFFSVDEVKRYIDVMAIHKLNTLHWHLTDDQGWRIEIKRYPELTAVGSIRKATVVRKEWGTYDGTPYGGFYTQDEIRDVVKYAADRGVTVIPEIDLPGHMLAALTAYPELGCTGGPYEVWGRWGVADDVLCPGREKTFEFLEGVLTEVMELFPSEYIHIGGDECPKVRWEKCPRCQAKIRQLGLKDDGEHTAEHYLQSYVTDRIGKFLAQHGRRIRRAAAQPRAHGDTLVQPDVHAAGEARALEKHLRRAHGHIVRPAGQIAAVGLGAADAGAVERNGHIVVQIHALHDHAQVVKPVGARTEHVQRQVQLCPRGLSCCTGHSFFSSKSRSMSCAPSSTYGPLAPFASEYGRPEPSDTRLSYSTNGTGSAPCAPLAMYVV